MPRLHDLVARLRHSRRVARLRRLVQLTLDGGNSVTFQAFKDSMLRSLASEDPKESDDADSLIRALTVQSKKKKASGV